jgi:hypothetical protein
VGRRRSPRNDRERYLRSAPGAGATLAFFVGLLVAPDLDGASSARFASLFATCAQVVAALLVVIAVEISATTFRGLDLRASDVKTGLTAGCVSVISAIAALSPSLPNAMYELAFGLAVGGAVGALGTVVMVGAKAIDQAREAADLAALQRRARLGDDAARSDLARMGEPSV